MGNSQPNVPKSCPSQVKIVWLGARQEMRAEDSRAEKYLLSKRNNKWKEKQGKHQWQSKTMKLWDSMGLERQNCYGTERLKKSKWDKWDTKQKNSNGQSLDKPSAAPSLFSEWINPVLVLLHSLFPALFKYSKLRCRLPPYLSSHINCLFVLRWFFVIWSLSCR